MVGLYQRRNPQYNVKTTLHKKVVPTDGSMLYYNQTPDSTFYCKDNGFTTTYVSQNGHTEAVTTGQLETKDLADGEIMPDDYVCYCGKMYVVVQVKFSDEEMPKMVTNRPSGITVIDLRR